MGESILIEQDLLVSWSYTGTWGRISLRRFSGGFRVRIGSTSTIRWAFICKNKHYYRQNSIIREGDWSHSLGDSGVDRGWVRQRYGSGLWQGGARQFEPWRADCGWPAALGGGGKWGWVAIAKGVAAGLGVGCAGELAASWGRSGVFGVYEARRGQELPESRWPEQRRHRQEERGS